MSILATIQFPGGHTINLGDDGRWTGAPLAELANAITLPVGYYPDVPSALTVAVANELVGTVTFLRTPNQDIPDDATP